MITDEAVPAQAFWQPGSTTQAPPLQGMASPLSVRSSPGSARHRSLAHSLRFTSYHDQMRRALRTDAECDDRDRLHREHWQRGPGNGTVWSKEADIQWCEQQLQQRAKTASERQQRAAAQRKQHSASRCQNLDD